MPSSVKKGLIAVGVLVAASVSASATPLIPDTFTLLSAGTITDIGTVTSALMLFLGTILVAKSVIGFIRGR